MNNFGNNNAFELSNKNDFGLSNNNIYIGNTGKLPEFNRDLTYHKPYIAPPPIINVISPIVVTLPNIAADNQYKIDQQKNIESAKQMQELHERCTKKYECPAPVVHAPPKIPYKDPTPWVTFIVGGSNAFPDGRPT
jgi:hypothetical protein